MKQQNRDGGYGFSPRAASDADDTGAVLQALAAGGRQAEVAAARRAVAYLSAAQHSDGGCGQMTSQPSNAQSTSWAVQGLVAAGRSPARFKKRGRSPLRLPALAAARRRIVPLLAPVGADAGVGDGAGADGARAEGVAAAGGGGAAAASRRGRRPG